MIVINPPAAPAQLTMITRTPEHRAVEAAIRIARVKFQCEETEDPISWLRLLQRWGSDITFVLDLPSPTSITVTDAAAVPGAERHQHLVIDGAAGILELSASIGMLA